MTLMPNRFATKRRYTTYMKIAYLGPAGTFSEEAARIYGTEHDAYLAAPTFDQVVEMAESHQADLAVVAVENSTEGSVDRTLDLLLDTSLHICGEVCLPVHHQLLRLADSMDDIREVVAHPQALGQCRHWLDKHLPDAKRTPTSSNAQAAELAAGDEQKAAIAGKQAADIYKLTVVAGNIEDAADNTTRFFILGSEDASRPTDTDKTSIVCSVPNRAGSLYELLGIFARRHINMSKLESRPAPHATWDYNFFIDIDGHRAGAAVAAALKEAEAMCIFLKIIGSYPAAQ
jgi:chorismate mutase / prephenate dehydratase